MNYQALALLFVLATAQTLADLNATVNSEVAFSKNFASSVYKIVKNTNVVCSPLSAYFLLAQLTYGSGGRTYQQLFDALSLPKNVQSSMNGLKSLWTELKDVKNLTLNVANKVITRRGFEFDERFVNYMKNVFGSEISAFNGSAQELVNHINKWVDSTTNHKIQQLIDETQIDNATIFLLVNAVYLDAKWKYPFSKASTRKYIFTDLDKKRHNVSVMIHVGQSFNHGTLNDYPADWIELPFENSDFKMILVVPTEEEIDSESFENLGKELQKYSFKNLPKTSYDSDVTLALPKFKYESYINLQPVLENLKVTELFTPEANFTVMSKNAIGETLVSKIIQKVVIDVSESGTIGAAASYSSAVLRSGNALIRATKPFYFSIESNTYGVLFQGRVLLPTY